MDTPPPQKSEENMNKLEEMPQVVMEHILKHCDYFDINSLRKTCTKTRHLVDIINPDPQVKFLRCKCSADAITFCMEFRNREERKIDYKDDIGECIVTEKAKDRNRPVSRYFEDTTATEMFYRDFKILLPMLMRQRVPLDDCHLILGKKGLPVFQETVAHLLAEFNTQLRTLGVSLQYHGRPRIMAMLPLICAETLEDLNVMNQKKRDKELDLTQVVELEQWRRPRHISFNGYLPDTLDRFQNTPHFFLHLKKLSPETFTSLVEVLRNSPNFEECFVSDDSPNEWEEHKGAMPPQGDPDAWYFTTITPGFVLKVVFYLTIKIKRIANGELHGREIIHEGF